MSKSNLSSQHCTSATAGDALDEADIQRHLGELDGWRLAPGGKSLVKNFKFKDFHHTLGFINAVGFMANREDHHPDIEAGYGHCQLTWSTHDAKGLTLNDFICAARVDALVQH